MSPPAPAASPPGFGADAIDPLALDNQLCFAVYSAANAFQRAYQPLLAGLGLTYPQYLVMLTLWQQPEPEPGWVGPGLMVKDIGARLHLGSSTLTPLLKRLESAGLVSRTRDDQDERQVRIRLTPAGRALRQAAAAVPRGVVAALGCPVEEIHQLRSTITALRDRLDAAGLESS